MRLADQHEHERVGCLLSEGHPPPFAFLGVHSCRRVHSLAILAAEACTAADIRYDDSRMRILTESTEILRQFFLKKN